MEAALAEERDLEGARDAALRVIANVRRAVSGEPAIVERATACSDADIVLMAAAVSDYRPVETEVAKRPKDQESWEIELEPTVDVLRELSERRTNGQVLVGFAAEAGADVGRAEAKRVRKGVDLIVLNDVSRRDIGFDVDHNEVVLVAAGDATHVPRATKRAIAGAVLDRVEQLLSS